MVQGKQIIYGANVEFRQSSKPTVRSDGSALQAGDRWLDTTERLWFYWNGTYWLSEQIYAPLVQEPTSITGATLTYPILPISSAYDIYLLDYRVSGNGGSHDGSNYYTIFLSRVSSALAVTNIDSIVSASGGFNSKNDLNTHLDVSALDALFLSVRAVRTGTTPTLGSFAATIRYRLAKL